MKRTRSMSATLTAVAVLALGASAGAVDGTVEINQAKVTAAGGFPYAIATGGSYRLTGNLTVASGSADAIDVSVDNVTIDLNGFSIVGPGASSVKTGINASSVAGTTVENGTVTGFAGSLGTGVNAGTNSIVRNVHADSNFYGISAGSDSLVQGCTANNSGDVGITGNGNGVVLSGNSANYDYYGIFINGTYSALITGNTLTNDTFDGIHAGSTSVGYTQ